MNYLRTGVGKNSAGVHENNAGNGITCATRR